VSHLRALVEDPLTSSIAVIIQPGESLQKSLLHQSSFLSDKLQFIFLFPFSIRTHGINKSRTQTTMDGEADGSRPFLSRGARPPQHADPAARARDGGAEPAGDLPKWLQRPLRAVAAACVAEDSISLHAWIQKARHMYACAINASHTRHACSIHTSSFLSNQAYTKPYLARCRLSPRSCL
jgi:hypothetical protein